MCTQKKKRKMRFGLPKPGVLSLAFACRAFVSNTPLFSCFCASALNFRTGFCQRCWKIVGSFMASLQTVKDGRSMFALFTCSFFYCFLDRRRLIMSFSFSLFFVSLLSLFLSLSLCLCCIDFMLVLLVINIFRTSHQ